MTVILAHGALGTWDEFFFLGIAIVFTGFMGMSWWRSRDFEPELEEEFEGDDAHEIKTPHHEAGEG